MKAVIRAMSSHLRRETGQQPSTMLVTFGKQDLGTQITTRPGSPGMTLPSVPKSMTCKRDYEFKINTWSNTMPKWHRNTQLKSRHILPWSIGTTCRLLSSVQHMIELQTLNA
jgi:hypothetical protein